MSAPASPSAALRDAPLKLYGTAASRTARPLWMLEELGLRYERIVLDYRHRATRTPFRFGTPSATSVQTT